MTNIDTLKPLFSQYDSLKHEDLPEDELYAKVFARYILALTEEQAFSIGLTLIDKSLDYTNLKLHTFTAKIAHAQSSAAFRLKNLFFKKLRPNKEKSYQTEDFILRNELKNVNSHKSLNSKFLSSGYSSRLEFVFKQNHKIEKFRQTNYSRPKRRT